MTEQFATGPDVAFKAALADAAMTAPGGATPLFDPAIFDVRLGGSGSIGASQASFTVPLPKVVISIDNPYGTEMAYIASGVEQYVDREIWLPISIYANSAADHRDVRARFDFARDSRSAVFSAHGLNLVGGVVREARIAYDTPLGLVIGRFGWRVWFGRTSAS